MINIIVHIYQLLCIMKPVNEHRVADFNEFNELPDVFGMCVKVYQTGV